MYFDIAEDILLGEVDEDLVCEERVPSECFGRDGCQRSFPHCPHMSDDRRPRDINRPISKKVCKVRIGSACSPPRIPMRTIVAFLTYRERGEDGGMLGMTLLVMVAQRSVPVTLTFHKALDLWTLWDLRGLVNDNPRGSKMNECIHVAVLMRRVFELESFFLALVLVLHSQCLC